MRKEKKDDTLIFYDAELLATPSPDNVCCVIEDEDITEDHYYIPENRYYMKTHPGQESELIWHTARGRFWMNGQIAHPSKVTITLCRAKS